MSSYDSVAAERPVLRITGEMNIYRAGELKQAFVDALRADVLDVDLSDVSEIDAAGVQLLVAAHKQAFTSGRTLRVVAHSPAITDALDLLGLAACLGVGETARECCASDEKCFAHAGVGHES